MDLGGELIVSQGNQYLNSLVNFRANRKNGLVKYDCKSSIIRVKKGLLTDACKKTLKNV